MKGDRGVPGLEGLPGPEGLRGPPGKWPKIYIKKH